MNIGYFTADEMWNPSDIKLLDDGSHFQDIAGHCMLITTDTWYEKNKDRIRNRIVYVIDTFHGIKTPPNAISITAKRAKDMLKTQSSFHNYCICGSPFLIEMLIQYMDKIYLTKLYTESNPVPKSDRYLNIDRVNGWYITECSSMKLESGTQYRFVVYQGPDRRI